MSMMMLQRIKALESKVSELTERLDSLEAKPVEQTRKLCPKCGVKPAYHFHVMYCQGQKNKNDDRNRNPSSP